MAKSRTAIYKNKRGGITQSTHSGNSVYREGVSVDTIATEGPRAVEEQTIKRASKTSKGKLDKYSSSTEKNRRDRYVGERFPKDFEPSPAQNKKSGHIRKGKTPEQIKAQIERIQRNAWDLLRRDYGVSNQDRMGQIARRLNKAADAAMAYRDYHSLGAKGSSNG